jgi:hypothetical protein
MINTAIQRAYQTMEKRGWDTIYWAIDLHGVCLKSNYESGKYEWINEHALEGLKTISKRPENNIILWSSVHNEEKESILEFFHTYGIKVCGFNQNPYEQSNEVSCFDEKFYFSVLLDDKAGFDPYYDWVNVNMFYYWKDFSND